jgi:hypothetical protein
MSIIPNVIEYDEVPDDAVEVKDAADTAAKETTEKAPETPGDKQPEEQKKNNEVKPTPAEEQPQPEVKQDSKKAESSEEYMARTKKEAQEFRQEKEAPPPKEKPKASKDQIAKIHAFNSDINKVLELMGKKPMSDEKYRANLQRAYGVDSSKDLTQEQAEDLISKLRKQKMDLETSDEAKAARAAAYKAGLQPETDRKSPEEALKAAREKQKQQDRPENVNEDGEIIDPSKDAQGKPLPENPPKDFVKDARINLIMAKFQAGEPLWDEEYLQIGIDPKDMDPGLVMTKDKAIDRNSGAKPGGKQATLFDNNDDDIPEFLRGVK